MATSLTGKISPEALIEKFQYALDNGWGYIWGAAGEIWTAEKQKKATRQQTIDYGSQWIGKPVADCSGLFYWAFKQLGGYMYHGSNTMYRSYCAAKGAFTAGSRSDGQKLKPGTALFTGTEDDHGHVGLYIGDGWVIEAQGTKAGVVRSKASLAKWTFWGELKGVDYEETSRPTIRKGSKGEAVTRAQTLLESKGYDLGRCGVDGAFGSATEKAVREFQRDHGLAADGIVGPKTWAELEKTGTNLSLYTVTIPHMPKYQAEALVKVYAGASMKEEGV